MLEIRALQFQFQKSNTFKLTLYCIVVKNRKYTIFFKDVLQTCAAKQHLALRKKEVSRGFSYIKGAKASIDQNLCQFPDAGDFTREYLLKSKGVS